jgi:hypothetical protein
MSSSPTAPPDAPFPRLDRATRARIVREAITLPLIFLTVAFGGGLRVGAVSHQLVFLPPSLMSLVLALLLLAALVRTDTLAPDALMRLDRRPLANLSGLLVVITLFTAAAQVFNTTTPEAGLLQFIVNLFFLLLLWNTVAARPDRQRMTGSLIVILGGAFVVKYVLLAALYDPAGGLTRRVLMTMLEGVTLGGLTYQSPAPATGYVAFFTVLLFLIGVTLLPQRPMAAARPRQRTIAADPPAALVLDPEDR